MTTLDNLSYPDKKGAHDFSMTGKFVLMAAISIGGSIGWRLGAGGGIMGSYLTGVLCASIGFYIGRRLQKNLDGDS
jgi:hypothetical protein